MSVFWKLEAGKLIRALKWSGGPLHTKPRKKIQKYWNSIFESDEIILSDQASMFKACDKVAAFMANEHNFWHLIKFTNETKKLKICSAPYNFIEKECSLRQNRTQGTKGYENQGTKKGTKRNENLEQNP